MAEIEWTDEGSRSLREIFDYLSEYNAFAAEKTLRGILQKAEMLRRFPEMGPPLQGYDYRGVRCLMYGHYRILYLHGAGEKVYILGVYHSAMDYDRLL